MRIAFLYTGGRIERLPLIANGTAPTEFFYGACELAALGHRVLHLETGKTNSSLTTRALAFATPRSVLPVKTDIPLVSRVGDLCARLNEADAVVATAGNLAFAAAHWHASGRLRPPVIGIHCGTLDYHHNAARKMISRRLLLHSHTMLFGEAEQKPFREFFDLPDERVAVNCFGVDADFWKPADRPEVGDYVLAVGNDGRRDYATLLAAAEKIGVPIRIVTQRHLPEPLPPNVTVIRGSWQGAELSDEALRELYRGAACVAVPIIETLQPSGQSVTLQAMACGRPVVLSRFSGLWSREQLRDGNNVLLANSGDAADFARQVRRVLEEPVLAQQLGAAGRAMVAERATARGYADRLAALLERVVQS